MRGAVSLILAQTVLTFDGQDVEVDGGGGEVASRFGTRSAKQDRKVRGLRGPRSVRQQ